MTDIKHETKQNASHTVEAEALADAVLIAAGSGLRHYSMAKTQVAILSAAQRGLDAARAELFEALQAVLPYAKNEIAIINIRSDGTEANEAEADEANAALAQVNAAIAKAKGLAA